TVYLGIFEPSEIGWGSTYTFDGILLATIVMVCLDALIWPSSLEPKLLESIATDLTLTRGRFASVGRRYLDPVATTLPAPLVKSRLAPTLALLNSVEEQMKLTPQRLAVLLDAVMTSEHVYLEVERLAVLAEEPVADGVRQKHSEEIESSLRVLDSALAGQIDRILSGLSGIEESTRWPLDLRVAIHHLGELSVRASSAVAESGTAATLNFLGFVGGLEAIGSLLEPRERPPSPTAIEATEADNRLQAPPFVDRARLRFSIKFGATIVLGLLVG